MKLAEGRLEYVYTTPEDITLFKKGK